MTVKCKAEKGTVLIDTREKRPYRIAGAAAVKLDVGDYSLAGFQSEVAFERKGFDDLFNCLTRRQREFRAQLRALGKVAHRGLIIDSTPELIAMGHFRCGLPGEVALRRLIGWCDAQQVPIWFAGKKGVVILRILLALALQQLTAAGR